MKYFLPTYNEAKLIVDANDNFIFFMTEHKINGYDVHIFSYRLSPKNFNNPLEKWVGYDAKLHHHITAHELRGLTFIFNKDGSLYKRYLLMNKFFNINQVEETLYDNIKDLQIDNIMNKEDGSIISFIQLPDGTIHAKSKASFESYQSNLAQELFNKNHNGLKNFIEWLNENDLVGIFELVSPNNLIVLEYKKDDLILLQIRCNKTGVYLDINETINKYITDKSCKVTFNIAKVYNHTLDEIIELSEKETDIEGYIIKFKDNDKNITFVKQKTQWYFNKHSLYFRELNQENLIIRMILDDTIDDVISNMQLSGEKRIYIQNIVDALNADILNVANEIVEICKDKSLSDKFEVYTNNKTHPYITDIMKYLTYKDYDKLINSLKLTYRKKYFRYHNALEYLKSIGVNRIE